MKREIGEDYKTGVKIQKLQTYCKNTTVVLKLIRFVKKDWIDTEHWSGSKIRVIEGITK